MAIGSQCKAQHIAEYGECWNCGKEEFPSEAGSEAGFWAPHDPKDYEGEQPAFPSTDDAGRNPATAKVEAGSVLPSGSSFGGQDSTNPSSNTRVSGSSQIAQHLSVSCWCVYIIPRILFSVLWCIYYSKPSM